MVVEVADLGTRAAALLIDLLIVVCATVLVALLCMWALAPVVGSSLSAALFYLCSFLLRGPYFLFFELRWQGQTPGKRWLGLRVVDRRGGALSPRGLVARNLMREVEVFMPMGLLLALQFGGDEPWLYYSALLWMGVFTLMPLFNRDRLRVGDMLGGTWVVAAGGRTLGRDLASRWGASGASTAAAATEAPSPVAVFRFNAGQLDVYGIAELQVLEKLLRGPRTPTTRETIEEVCERIRAKVGWPTPVSGPDVERFLEDYYAALRGHLELRALFGDRRADKFALRPRAAARTAASTGEKAPRGGKRNAWGS